MIIFKIKINNVWTDKSQYVQLPINIIQTLDETMDRAEVTLNFTPDENEYEPYDFAYLEIDGREYYMMVESDSVQELTEGITSFYKHEITLIEATQYLSTLDVNDFATTQELEFLTGSNISSAVYDVDIKETDKWVYSEIKNNPSQWRQNGAALTLDTSSLGSTVSAGIYKVIVALNGTLIKKFYNKDQTTQNWDAYLSLPDISATFTAKAEQRLLGSLVQVDELIFDLAYTESLINTDTNQIYSLPSGSNRRLVLSDYPAGNYTYRIRVNNQFWNTLSNSTKLNSRPFGIIGDLAESGTWEDAITTFQFANQGGISGTTNLKDFYYSFQIINSAEEVVYKLSMADVLIKALNNTTLRKLKDGRYFRQIDLSEYNSLITSETYGSSFATDVAPEVMFGPANGFDYGSRFSLSIVNPPINKYYKLDSLVIQGQVPNISDFDNNLKSNIFYSEKLDLKYDQNILDKAALLSSLDFTFVGGRNLLEILFELGKTIGGIPRLYFDNNLEAVISFDILEDLITNPFFEDTFTVMKKTASTSNYATNAISEIQNAILSDNVGLKSSSTVIYPSATSWVTPRAIDFDRALMRPDTMALTIDDPNQGIFRIVKLEITNFNNANTVLDITDYVHEQSGFESFENALRPSNSESKDYKSIALYYKRGENQILNIGEITDPDNIFGVTGTKYNIERIILDALNIALGSNPTDNKNIISATITKPQVLFQYRIEYVPIIKSSRVFVEQSNVTLEKKSINMPFNQSETNISIAQFFQAADNSLKRNGIPSIQKSYIFKSLEQVPSLGQKLDFNGYDYFADKISISYENSNVQCEVQYSREVNRVDPLVGFNKEFREYNLDVDNTVWKRVNLNNYAFFTETDVYNNTNFSATKSIFPKSLANTVNNTLHVSDIEKLRGAVFNYYDLNGRTIRYDKQGAIRKIKPAAMSLIGIPAGNSLMFTSSMYDNFSSGRKMSKIPYDVSNTIGQIEGLVLGDGSSPVPFERNRLSQDYVRYVDDNGRADVCRILFLKESDTATFNPLTVPEVELFDPLSVQAQPNLYNYKTGYITKAVLDETLYIDKDNREAIQFTYQLHAVSKSKNIEVRPALMKYNKLVTDISKQPVNPGGLVTVGVRDMAKMKKQKIYNYDSADVLQAQTLAQYNGIGLNNRQVGLIGTTLTNTKQTTYEGIALVFSGTKEIALLKKKDTPPGATVGAVYVSFSEEIL